MSINMDRVVIIPSSIHISYTPPADDFHKRAFSTMAMPVLELSNARNRLLEDLLVQMEDPQ